MRVTRCPGDGAELAPATYAATLEGVAYGVRECPRCHRRALDPRPAPAALAYWYGPSYFGASTRKFIGPVEAFVDLFRDGRAREAARLLARRPAASGERPRVLDVGCGSGLFLAALEKRGFECHGTEFSDETAGRARALPGLRVHAGPIDAETYAPGSFDLISIWHVLEHLGDPDELLRYSARWLRPGGALMVAVPNIDSWQARLFRGAWFHLDPPRHFFHFGPRSLGSALEAAGFRVERMRHLSWEQNLYGVIQSALNSLGFPRDDLYETLKGNRPLLSAPRDAIEVLLAAALFPPAVLFTIGEAAFRHGGTIECVATRTDA
jgi:SAM-dependent methyltransferase